MLRKLSETQLPAIHSHFVQTINTTIFLQFSSSTPLQSGDVSPTLSSVMLYHCMIHHRFNHLSLCPGCIPCLLTAILALVFGFETKASDKDESHCCLTGIAVKTNMLHDLLLTPDLGIELNFHRRFSVSAEGVWAWWSRNSAHRYWRIYGGWLEGRYWFSKQADTRSMSGHHIGVYISLHTYDFEFGGKGWQAPDEVFGVGVGYGYSFPISDRLNIDLAARIGYSSGRQITYRPQCGEYVCISDKTHRYFGPTDLSVSLVWYIGKNTYQTPTIK